MVRASRLPPPSVRQRIRRKARVSLRMMGAQLGVTPMTVLRWEHGDAEPRLAHAIAYRRLLDELQDAS
jgi:DNA-binding XRE family transcriptional regulator